MAVTSLNALNELFNAKPDTRRTARKINDDVYFVEREEDERLPRNTCPRCYHELGWAKCTDERYSNHRLRVKKCPICFKEEKKRALGGVFALVVLIGIICAVVIYS